MKKLVKVHILPTEDRTQILYNTYKFTVAHGNPLVFDNNVMEGIEERGYISKHLYFTSDEEIKKGDWIEEQDTVYQVSKDCNNVWPTSRKIVATTDKALHNFHIHTGSGKYWEDEPTIMKSDLSKPMVYDIPQQFIEDYCEKGGIDEVYLETEQDLSTVRKLPNGLQTWDYKIRVTSINCVITRPTKPKLYTRKEVERFIWKMEGGTLSQEQLKFIQENLK